MNDHVMTTRSPDPAAVSVKRPFWKRYYYEYLDGFISFLVPGDSSAGYTIISDGLGHVEDVQAYLEAKKAALPPDGRIVITQYSALWEPVLRLVSHLGLRTGTVEQNWLSMGDLKNFACLAGLEPVKSGTKMLMPVYIPLASFLLNAYLANIWPFDHLGLFHYVVLRKPEPRLPVKNLSSVQPKPSISIIVPARNEAGTIEKIARELPELGASTEIVFIEGIPPITLMTRSST